MSFLFMRYIYQLLSNIYQLLLLETPIDRVNKMMDEDWFGDIYVNLIQ